VSDVKALAFLVTAVLLVGACSSPKTPRTPTSSTAPTPATSITSVEATTTTSRTTSSTSGEGAFSPAAMCGGVRAVFANTLYGGVDKFAFQINAKPGDKYISYQGGTEPDETSPGWHCEFDQSGPTEFVEARLINVPVEEPVGRRPSRP
jgi:hypothetical protein